MLAASADAFAPHVPPGIEQPTTQCQACAREFGRIRITVSEDGTAIDEAVLSVGGHGYSPGSMTVPGPFDVIGG